MAFKKQLVYILLFLLGIANAYSQNTERFYRSHELNQGILNIQVNDGNYVIRPFSKSIVETSFLPTGETTVQSSAAVVMEPQNPNFELTENKDRLFFKSEGLSIEVTKSPFQISYYYKDAYVLSEAKGYSKTEDFEQLAFNLTQSEVLMGGGGRALGMNRRGHRLQLYNRAHYGYETYSELLNFTLPIVFSSKKYLLHFDNAPIGYLDLDSKNANQLVYETENGRKTYQIIAGENWKSIISDYTELTGRQPMPPRWALGNFASRFGYHSQKEVEETIQKFKEDSIPVDAVVLDLYWFGHTIKGTMGNLEFVKDSFPQPKKMIQNLKDKGVKTVLITEPFILTTSTKWEAAVDAEILTKDSLENPATYDFYFGNTGLIDVFKPEAKDWFWNIYKKNIEIGIAGHWGDLGEPEVHPSYLRHVMGTANEVHNIFGNEWAKLIYKGYREDFPNRRPFILMRAGYAGAQRFGMIPWSGDVNRSWGGLKPQPEIALQMGMQGLAYMHSDLGGFAGANKDDELYVRWLQYGVFQPVFRPHAQEEVASEPVFKDAATRELAKQAIELRYRLLPYNYTLAFENHKNGWPLMRPLFFEQPDNFEAYFVSNTYLWGPDLLIAPILEKGQQQKRIQFPNTSNWYQLHSGKKYDKGTKAVLDIGLNQIPVFVRGGAFITMAPLVQTTANYSAKNLQVHFYYDKEEPRSQTQIYNDDGETANAYEKDRYEILKLKAIVNGKNIKISAQREVGSNYNPEIANLEFIVHNLAKAPKSVSINGKKVNSKFKIENKLVKFQLQLIKKEALIEIKF